MAATAAVVVTRPIAPEQASLWSDAWRRRRRIRVTLAGGIFLGLVVVVALVAIVNTPYPNFQVGVGIPSTGPSARQWLGVDFFFFSSRRRHTRLQGDWSSDVCSSD